MLSSVFKSRSKLVATAIVIGALATSVFGAGGATAAYGRATGTLAPKISFAALNVLNINKKDAISLFGTKITFDASKAGSVEFSSLQAPADKSSASVNRLAGEVAAIGPTVTFSSVNLSYSLNLKSEVFPSTNNAESEAAAFLGPVGAIGQGGSGRQVKVLNPNFPKGTYAVSYDMALHTKYGTFKSKELQIVAGWGNKLAVYLFNFTPLKPGTAATGYAKLFTAVENLVSKKILSTARNSV